MRDFLAVSTPRPLEVFWRRLWWNHLVQAGALPGRNIPHIPHIPHLTHGEQHDRRHSAAADRQHARRTARSAGPHQPRLRRVRRRHRQRTAAARPGAARRHERTHLGGRGPAETGCRHRGPASALHDHLQHLVEQLPAETQASPTRLATQVHAVSSIAAFAAWWQGEGAGICASITVGLELMAKAAAAAATLAQFLKLPVGRNPPAAPSSRSAHHEPAPDLSARRAPAAAGITNRGHRIKHGSLRHLHPATRRHLGQVDPRGA